MRPKMYLPENWLLAFGGSRYHVMYHVYLVEAVVSFAYSYQLRLIKTHGSGSQKQAYTTKRVNYLYVALL